MSNYENMSLTDLKNLAKEHNIKNISKLKKEEVISVLNQVLGDNNDTITSNSNIEKNHNRGYEDPIIDYKLSERKKWF
mgnify:FL=1